MVYYLELSKNIVRFDPVSSVTNVFFDEANIQVFAVRSGGETGVIVKGPTDKSSFTFRLKDRGPLISIKFSYEQRVLGLQRSERSVEFSNFEEGASDPIEYSQTCKGKTNKILTFHWTSTNEVVFVTEHGIEFYQINSEKRFLKLIKSHTISINWSVFSPEASVLLASSASNFLVPFYFKNGQVIKLQKFDVESPKLPSNKLHERDVVLLSLYNSLYAGVLRHPTPNSNEKCLLDIFLIKGDSPVRKIFILKLGLVGRFAFNVVDNLIIAHHQLSKTSMMFDIKLPGVSRSNVIYLEPLLDPLPIRPFILKTQEFSLQKGSQTVKKECNLYSPTWIVFRPDIVIDAELGCLWNLRLDLDGILEMFQDQCSLVDFLLLRRSSKPTILKVLKRALLPSSGCSFIQIGSFFSKLNQVYKDYLDAEQFYQQKITAQPDAHHTPHHRSWVLLDQNDVFTHILNPYISDSDVTSELKISVLLEYVKSLDSFNVEVQHFVYELLVSTLIRAGGFFQLEQLLHHRVIEDSKPVACRLLTLESQHPGCFQLALDMLKRLATSDEQVIEVMLSKRMILPALRFIRHVGMYDLIPARKFLSAAMHDDMLFYSVYKFFEARNIRLNGKPEFTAAERCNEYMDHYVTNFCTDVIQ